MISAHECNDATARPVENGHRLQAMLIAYGDDSSDSKKATVFSVGIVLGSHAQWARFKPTWESRNGRIPFHATDCESGWGDYRNIDRDIRTRLYRDLDRDARRK
jgi:hypothetical protein